jgi:hypothetical protein
MTFFLAFLTAFAFLVAAFAFRGKCGAPGNGSICLPLFTGVRFLPVVAAFFLATLRDVALFAVFDGLAIIITLAVTEMAGV